jgi:hypothetical protein
MSHRPATRQARESAELATVTVETSSVRELNESHFPQIIPHRLEMRKSDHSPVVPIALGKVPSASSVHGGRKNLFFLPPPHPLTCDLKCTLSTFPVSSSPPNLHNHLDSVKPFSPSPNPSPSN